MTGRASNFLFAFPSEVTSFIRQFQFEAWRYREITDEFPYLHLDGVILKRSWAGEMKNVSVLVAIGVDTNGYHQILGVAHGEMEDLEVWRGFLRHLKDRELPGVRLIISSVPVPSSAQTLSSLATFLRAELRMDIARSGIGSPDFQSLHHSTVTPVGGFGRSGGSPI